jgi:hypothetical protein
MFFRQVFVTFLQIVFLFSAENCGVILGQYILAETTRKRIIGYTETT